MIATVLADWRRARSTPSDEAAAATSVSRGERPGGRTDRSLPKTDG